MDAVKLAAFRGYLDLARVIWGAVFTKDLKEWLQARLGPKYSDAQLALLDAHYVEGLEREADAEARAAAEAPPAE